MAFDDVINIIKKKKQGVDATGGSAKRMERPSYARLTLLLASLLNFFFHV